jgi:aspartate aminotransferase-like enzyme
MPAAECQRLLAQQGVVVATGQGPLKDRILRIAHMGYCTEEHIDGVLNALQSVLEFRRVGRTECPDSS